MSTQFNRFFRRVAMISYSLGVVSLIIGIVLSVTVQPVYASNQATNGGGDHKIWICHVPSGNPGNARAIEVDASSWDGHKDHSSDFQINGPRDRRCGGDDDPTKTNVPPTKTNIPATKTNVPPTSVPPTSVPPTSVPPTSVPPTDVPPTDVPPTEVPPTEVPPTDVPTKVPPTDEPPTATPEVTLQSTPQNTETVVPSDEPTNTVTPEESTGTPQASETPTNTPFETATNTPTNTATDEPTATSTSTFTETATLEPTLTETPTMTPTELVQFVSLKLAWACVNGVQVWTVTNNNPFAVDFNWEMDNATAALTSAAKLASLRSDILAAIDGGSLTVPANSQISWSTVAGYHTMQITWTENGETRRSLSVTTSEITPCQVSTTDEPENSPTPDDPGNTSTPQSGITSTPFIPVTGSTPKKVNQSVKVATLTPDPGDPSVTEAVLIPVTGADFSRTPLADLPLSSLFTNLGLLMLGIALSSHGIVLKIKK